MVKRSAPASSIRPLTPKGKATRVALLEAAQEVFKDQGYYSTSVSEITRRCRVSMGTYYQYFQNKEQLFLELNRLIINRFWDRARALPRESRDPEKRLAQVVQLLFDHISEYLYFHRILGEFELIDTVTIPYYDSMAGFLKTFFRQEARSGSIRPFNPEMMAYGCIGIVYFQVLDWGPKAASYKPTQIHSLVLDLMLRGISGPKPWTTFKDWSIPQLPEKKEPPHKTVEENSQGQITKGIIFQSAEKIFGQVGFNRANISEITRVAGVAQGTFYIHFKSKRDLLEGFVRYLSRELRKTLRQATQGLEDRRDMEREGMGAFFRFLRLHSPIYRVVAESETVGPEVGMWYYKKLAEGYISGLRKGIRDKEIRNLPAPFLARSLMGFNHMLGLKWLVWKPFPAAEFPRPLLAEAIQFVMEGMSPSQGS
jgi:AcrR family transcriptional regulator